jgi:hypothetical protein
MLTIAPGRPTMRVLRYFIAAVAYVALMLWGIDKRNPEVEVSHVDDEVRPGVSGRLPGTSGTTIVVAPVSPVGGDPSWTVEVRPIVSPQQWNEPCAPDNPHRSVFTKSALNGCDRWEKSRSADRELRLTA